MNEAAVISGAWGVLVYIPMIYYLVRTVQNLAEHQEVAVRMFFLDDESYRTFWLIFGLAVIGNGGGTILAAVQQLYMPEHTVFSWAVRFVLLAPLAGFVYAAYNIADITAGPHE